MIDLLLKNKRGAMDDFTDLLSFALILSMITIFAMIVLRTDADEKSDSTLERISSLQGQEALLDLINSPVTLEGKEVLMKDIILLAVNTNDNVLFESKMEEIFKELQLEGGAAVYDAVSYNTLEDPEALLSYNVGIFDDEKAALYLTNVDGTGDTRSVVVKLFG